MPRRPIYWIGYIIIRRIQVFHTVKSLRLRPPKMRGFAGRLRGVLAYKNRNTGSVSSDKMSRHIYFLAENLLHVIPYVYMYIVVAFYHWKVIVYCILWGAWCVQRTKQTTYTMRQEVAYKRLKTMGNYKTVSPVVVVAYESWLFTRGSNYRALAGKIWCFELVVDRLWDFERYIRGTQREYSSKPL